MMNRVTSIYPGWKVLIGCFVCAAMAVGFTSYVFGMFVVPVTEEFGISRASFNNAMIAYMVGCGILSPFVGQLLDRFSARRLIVLGGFLFGGTLMVASRSSSLWLMLLLIAVPLSFGGVTAGALGANTVVVRWFQQRRGRALGLLAISTSVGGFVAQPIMAYLIETFGWRDALFTIGAGSALIFVLMALFLVRDRPTPGATRGYEEEFAAPTVNPAQPSSGKPERTWSAKELLMNRNFWLLSLAVGLLFGADQALVLSLVPYLQDMGHELSTAALLVSVMVISSIAGKLIVGALADKVDLRILYGVVAGCNTVLMLTFVLQPALWVLFAVAGTLGIAVGGVFPVWTTLMAWLFGSKSYGTVMGLMVIIKQVLAIIALRFVGQAYDVTGSYIPAFAVFVGAVLLSLLLVVMLRPEPRNQEETATIAAVAKQPG